MRAVYNPFLKRYEVEYEFTDGNGKISRKDAAEAIAKELKKSPENVIPVYLKGTFGMRNLKGLFYVYDDIKLARMHIKKYLWLRMLPKEERKKAYDEMRKKKVEKK
ncbi:MAG: hypothetical protein ACP5LW_04400 [Nitrososphaeria archaeon]